MNHCTRFFLILLRLAIGWHFLVEGIEKIHSIDHGPGQGKPWTSETYLRESAGPFAAYFRSIPGDPDLELIERLKLPTIPAQSPGGPSITPADRIPKPLRDDYDGYFTRLVEFYQVPKDQELPLRGVLEEEKAKAVEWLAKGTKEVRKTSPWGPPVTQKQTTPQRVAEYESKVEQLRNMLEGELPRFEADVGAQRLAALKADVRRLRADLQADLLDRQRAYQTALDSKLTPEQKQKGAVPDGAQDSTWMFWTWKPIVLADRVTMYGLTAVGVCLILGLFTRTACVAGAAFLLLFYLAMPPFPGVPENPKAEGHYLFINKNLIEMLALLVLATTASGRWAGLDGILHVLNPFRKTTQET